MNKYLKFYLVLFVIGVIHSHYLLSQEITFQNIAPPLGSFAGYVGGITWRS